MVDIAIPLCKLLILQRKNRAHLKAYVKRIITSVKNIFYNKNIMLMSVPHAAKGPNALQQNSAELHKSLRNHYAPTPVSTGLKGAAGTAVFMVSFFIPDSFVLQGTQEEALDMQEGE